MLHRSLEYPKFKVVSNPLIWSYIINSSPKLKIKSKKKEKKWIIFKKNENVVGNLYKYIIDG